ncbi:hypothetical protein BT69DRAFT_48835 [Atractiella rhizophila]|nr:hypothetical protein BT69DRAFT_48835 [Atractiella rhizophila]
MPLDVLGHTRATLTEPASSFSIAIIALQRGIPSKRESSAFGPAFGSGRLHPIAGKSYELGHLEEVKVVTRFP